MFFVIFIPVYVLASVLLGLVLIRVVNGKRKSRHELTLKHINQLEWELGINQPELVAPPKPSDSARAVIREYGQPYIGITHSLSASATVGLPIIIKDKPRWKRSNEGMEWIES